MDDTITYGLRFVHDIKLRVVLFLHQLFAMCDARDDEMHNYLGEPIYTSSMCDDHDKPIRGSPVQPMCGYPARLDARMGKLWMQFSSTLPGDYLTMGRIIREMGGTEGLCRSEIPDGGSFGPMLQVSHLSKNAYT